MTMLRPLICLLLALTSSTAWAQAGGPGSQRVAIELAWRQTPLVAGQDARLGVVLEVTPGWHVQAGRGSGDERDPYIPTTIDLELPRGWTAGDVIWPEAHTFTLGSGQFAERLAGYEGTVLAAIPVAIPPGVTARAYEVTAKVGYQACDDQMCDMPTARTVSVAAEVAEEGAEQSAPADARIAALFAAVFDSDGSGKSGDAREPAEEGAAEAAVERAAEFDPSERLKVDLAWYEGALVPGREGNLGIILHLAPDWHIQAGKGSGDVKENYIATEINLTLPDGWTHEDVLWPEAHEFVLGEGEFAEELKGYEGRVAAVIPVRVPESVKQGEYEVGVSVTYQACDAMFCELPSTLEMVVAAPVIAESEIGDVAAIPADIADLIEKTMTREPATTVEGSGGTRETVREVAAFLQWWGSAAAVWLAMVWMVIRTVRITPKYLPRTLVLIVALLVSYGVFSFARAMTAEQDLWVKYSDAAFEDAREDGKIVFIKFTADWCANCQFNERLIVASEEAMLLLRSPEVVPMKVDFTGKNPEGERKKGEVGGGGIPLITVYHPGVEAPVVIRGPLPPSVQPVIDALKTPQVQQSVDTWTFDFLGYQFNVSKNATLVIFGLAFLAGFFMNFTPCVLPVIPLKILSLQAHAKHPARCFLLGLIFGLGIIALYAVLGVLIGLLGLLDWGQQFEKWWVNLPLGLVVGLMGFGMLGLFSIRLPQAVYMFNPQSDTTGGSFAMGVFTAILSTPCTGPLLGAAVAWAATQTRFVAFSTLLMMGVGMAFPYVLLTAKPSWLSKLPRTGPGSELVKQLMGLLLMAVAVYFICTAVLSFTA